MSLTYAQYVTQIATLAVVAEDDVNFVIILPEMIEYAELRIQRDLDFLQTVTANTSLSLVTNTRTLNIPLTAFVTVQNINVRTPAGTSNPSSATRNPLLPVTKEFLDAMYPSSTGAGLPIFFAPFSQQTWYFGPWPDANYSVEVVGTARFTPLSSGNTTTFISTYLPDLFIMASMIYVTLFQRNFGAVVNDPQMAVTYESQYQALLAGAQVEEARKKFSAAAWTSMAPAPTATPGR